MANQPHRRRGFICFSLNFAIVAVPMVYVSSQAKIVHDRRMMRNEIRGLDGGRKRGQIDRVNPSMPKYQLPWLRVLFGDVPYSVVGLDPNTDKAYRQRVRDLFPEAIVSAYKRVTVAGGSGIKFFPFPDEPPPKPGDDE